MNKQQTLSLLAMMFLAMSVSGQYANLREKLDNDYVHISQGTTLKFSYVERYPIVETPGGNHQVKCTIYDEEHKPVTGTPIYVINKYGLNEQEIPLPVNHMSTCNGFYILEVTGSNKGETYYLRFTFNIGAPISEPRVAIRVFLDGPYNSNTELMNDKLRFLCTDPTFPCTIPGGFPLEEPYHNIFGFIVNDYGAASEISPSVLQVNGNNAIVDWVFVELRSKTAMDSVKVTRSVLLQRDGDVVDMDGVSPFSFSNVEPGEYFLAVRHRNHLGVMTAGCISLANCTTTTVDFTLPETPTNGNYAQKNVNGKMTMWAGDFNADGRVIYQGPGNDILKLFTTVLYDPENVTFIANFISSGYLAADVELDGRGIYQGPGNDRSQVLLESIFMHPLNDPNIVPNSISSFVILEQLP